VRTDLDRDREKIISLLQSGTPRFEICRLYSCKYDTLKKRIDKWGVSHLKNPARKGYKKPDLWVAVEKHLVVGSTIGSHKLKERLWRAGLKPRQCEECGWQEVSVDGRLPLELHHINGNRWDNRIENLKVLCPNHHALKPGNSGNKLKQALVVERKTRCA
jgi:hypothetical protein